MSAPIRHDDDLDERSLYAPKWIREQPLPEPVVGAPATPTQKRTTLPPATPLAAMDSRWLRPLDGAPFEGDVGMRQLQLRQALEPQPVPDPPLRQPRTSVIGMIGRLAVAMTLAAVAALFIVGGISAPQNRSLASASRDAGPASLLSRFLGEPARPDQPQPARSVPRLVVEDRHALLNEPIVLGVALNGAAAGAFVLMTGFAAGSQMTAGNPVGANAWRLSAPELAQAAIVPPRNFTGTMDVVADLRLADDTVVDTRALRLDWTDPVARVSPAQMPLRQVVQAPDAAPSFSPQSAPNVRELDPDEIATLIKRGEEFFVQGDIAAARLMLERAAEARDPHAALALGATYDPNVLKRLGVLGFTPDAAQARLWYERAGEYGSADAPRRLDQLAQGVR